MSLFSQVINVCFIYFYMVIWCRLLYHGAGLNYGKDAAQNPRADEQLPLLAQMQVDVVQNHRQQNAPRL